MSALQAYLEVARSRPTLPPPVAEAYPSPSPRVRAIFDRDDVTPGLVVSIQTFGSYAANFHPHVHALVTDGAFTEEGEFLQLPYFDARLVEEVFRRRVLQRLHRAERLSEEFLNSLLGWVHSGFSVHGEQTVSTEDVQAPSASPGI